MIGTSSCLVSILLTRTLALPNQQDIMGCTSGCRNLLWVFVVALLAWTAVLCRLYYITSIMLSASGRAPYRAALRYHLTALCSHPAALCHQHLVALLTPPVLLIQWISKTLVSMTKIHSLLGCSDVAYESWSWFFKL